jgi:hypothetical protein
MSNGFTATQIPGWATATKIKEFSSYPSGWRYGEGVTPPLATAQAAMELNNEAAKGGLETDAFLGVDGDISLTVYREAEYLKFSIEHVNSIEYVREHTDREIDRKHNLSLLDALKILQDFRLETWLSSVSSTATTMIITRDISTTLHSRLLDRDQVFRWLKKIAQSEKVPHFANT